MIVPKPISYASAVAAVALTTLFVSWNPVDPSEGSGSVPDIVTPAAIADDFGSYDEFGFDIDQFDVATGTVRRNETLSDILQRFGATSLDVASVASESRGTFDVRDIRAGRPYRVYSMRERVAALVYEASPLMYVVFDLQLEPPVVQIWKRPVLVRQRTAEGTIESSLYETLVAAEADVELAFELAEIFAWQIDFYHLLPGDRFTVIYDQRFVNGESAGVGTVHAARFRNGGREFTAFHFDRQGDIAYFDEDGNSLRKSFLAAPVKYSRISSRYTGRRFHPVLKRYKAHLGTDYAAPRGTPIRATGDGEVVDARYRGNNGRYVKIRHNGTYTTAYLHMSRIANGIVPGKYVRQGDIIGYVGSTGLANGNHVCYRFWKHGRQVDPLRETFPSAEPVSEENRASFESVRTELAEGLNAISSAAVLPSYAWLLK